jgi:host factor-I protein
MWIWLKTVFVLDWHMKRPDSRAGRHVSAVSFRSQTSVPDPISEGYPSDLTIDGGIWTAVRGLTWMYQCCVQAPPRACGVAKKQLNHKVSKKMADRAQNLQDTFLNYVRKNKTPLTIFLVNGVKLQGVVTWFDNFCVLLRRDGHSQLVYKHAISTIMPGSPLQLFEPTEDDRVGG